MGFGCFSGDKESKRHAQSQLKFLEEQNLELASALNEWQALVRQLQQEAEGLKNDNASLGATVEQHERTIEQQASQTRDAENQAAELRQHLYEAQAQCHEVQLLWEASVNECSQLDSQLAAEKQQVTQLQHEIEGYRCDKEYLMEALEKREKALRMAEQVMDMVDMMQTPRGHQDLSEFNWGGEDLDGAADHNKDRASFGLLSGVLGCGLSDGPKCGSSDAAGSINAAEASAAVPCTSPRANGARNSHGTRAGNKLLAEQQSLPSSSSGTPPQHGAGSGAGIPSVQRSQSPDMRNMGLRRSIQATKLVLAQSRSSGVMRPASVPEAKDVELDTAAAAGEPASRKRKAEGGSGEGARGESPGCDARSSGGKEGSAVPAGKTRSSNGGSSVDRAAGSMRSSSSSSIVGGPGAGSRSKGVQGSAAGEGITSKCSSARSSKSADARCETAPTGSSAQGAGPKQVVPALRTPVTSSNGGVRRGSAAGVLDSLVGSVVYDAMGPSPIHTSTHGEASVASSSIGALIQQQGPQARTLASSLQGEQPVGGGVEVGQPRSAAANAAKLLDHSPPSDVQQQQALPSQEASGSLAYKVAMAMHAPQDSQKEKLQQQQQQQQQLGESAGISNGSVSHRGSADKDTALLRYHGAAGRAGSAGSVGSGVGSGASLTAAAACGGAAQGHSVRKGPSVRGPAGVLPGASRPSPLKLGAKLNGAGSHRSSISSSREDVVRDVDQGRGGVVA